MLCVFSICCAYLRLIYKKMILCIRAVYSVQRSCWIFVYVHNFCFHPFLGHSLAPHGQTHIFHIFTWFINVYFDFYIDFNRRYHSCLSLFFSFFLKTLQTIIMVSFANKKNVWNLSIDINKCLILCSEEYV